VNTIISRVRRSDIEVQCFIEEDRDDITNLQTKAIYLDSSVHSLESDYWDNNMNDVPLKKYLIQCLYDI
jgi:hypothetical protein